MGGCACHDQCGTSEHEDVTAHNYTTPYKNGVASTSNVTLAKPSMEYKPGRSCHTCEAMNTMFSSLFGHKALPGPETAEGTKAAHMSPAGALGATPYSGNGAQAGGIARMEAYVEGAQASAQQGAQRLQAGAVAAQQGATAYAQQAAAAGTALPRSEPVGAAGATMPPAANAEGGLFSTIENFFTGAPDATASYSRQMQASAEAGQRRAEGYTQQAQATLVGAQQGAVVAGQQAQAHMQANAAAASAAGTGVMAGLESMFSGAQVQGQQAMAQGQQAVLQAQAQAQAAAAPRRT
eukprot:TRINITY_DN56596_c0_g1_i1.p1 TRINITY_DN56596_c0_g1~~TRINITY_DN56596_c0_g1_i1.p1  ORF type:complete len:294 (+),score=57.16 TRINITY_DN56596_c0_g1_i1:45-926(+)